jgi:hypothetical protein
LIPGSADVELICLRPKAGVIKVELRGLRCSGTENRVKVATMNSQLRDGQFALPFSAVGRVSYAWPDRVYPS